MNQRPAPLSSPSLLGYVWAQRRALAPGMTMALLRICCVVPFPIIFKRITDTYLPNKDVAGIGWMALLMVGLLCAHQFFMVRGGYMMGRVVTRATLRLRREVLDKIQALSFSYLDRAKAGRLLTKYAFDTQKVDNVCMPILNGFIPNVFFSLATLAIFVWMDWRLSAVVLLMLPIFAILRTRYFKKLQDAHEKTRRSNERLSSEAGEVLGALRLVRSYAREPLVTRQLHQVDETVAGARLDVIYNWNNFVAFSYGSTQFLSLVVVAGGAMLAIYGSVTVGTVLAFVAGLPPLVQPIQIFTNIADQYFLGRESYRSVRELVDEDDVERWHGTRRPEHLAGRVEFDDVTFRYTADDAPALENFSLTIEPGESVALVGASGAGKSTVVSLLLGLYASGSGEIRIDGVPQRELDVRWLRERTALVMQENVLLSGTIADNLRFAKEDASDEELYDAARRALADDFIRALPNGYETTVGERGAKLSGGQKQRLAIARGLLRDPAILILDEPTSALDYASERLIQAGLDELSRGRTVITIAHRLSTIQNADRVVVLEAGRIVEQGRFEDLAHRDGHFRQMLNAASGEGLSPAA